MYISRGTHKTKRQTLLCNAAMTSIRKVHHESARHPTKNARLKRPYRVVFHTRAIVYIEVDVKTDHRKKNVYAFVYIAVINICFFQYVFSWQLF
jgi:hypothetical protein